MLSLSFLRRIPIIHLSFIPKLVNILDLIIASYMIATSATWYSGYISTPRFSAKLALLSPIFSHKLNNKGHMINYFKLSKSLHDINQVRLNNNMPRTDKKDTTCICCGYNFSRPAKLRQHYQSNKN